ncbi:MAG TPA: hypothetical protein VNC78_00035 [Actinomycetota bacterium]|nr:hypothetical protein [Actinomycetota bacterium]
MNKTLDEPGVGLHSFYRLTGAAGLAGGVLAIVANALHPRQSPGKLGDVKDFMSIIDGFALWRLVHLLIITSVLLSMFGLIGIARVLTDEGRSPWANLCLPLGVLMGAVAAVSFAIDGFVMGGAAEQWAHSHLVEAVGDHFQPRAVAIHEALQRAETLSLIDGAVFAVAIMGLFGAAQLVYALALLKSDAFPGWTGVVGLVGGLGGLLSGSLMWMTGGFDVFNFLVLFTLTSVLFTAWLIGCSLVLYKRGAPAPS